MDQSIDRRIIQQHASLDVMAQRHEVMWRDGTTVHLHPVSKDGVPQPFLRAMQLEGLRWLIFNLLKLPGVQSAPLQQDLLRLPTRDAQGVVYYTLRGVYSTGGVFTASAVQASVATWWVMGAGPMPEAA